MRFPSPNLDRDHAAMRWITRQVSHGTPDMRAFATVTRGRFAWMGGFSEGSVFYYKVHSPVILIEFDHQSPAGLRHINTPGKPNREHIHAVVRTPNGNDYGKDLLRQHYEKHPHPHSH